MWAPPSCFYRKNNAARSGASAPCRRYATLCELNELFDQGDEYRRLIFLAKVTRIM
jgi:hypothetical protein